MNFLLVLFCGATAAIVAGAAGAKTAAAAPAAPRTEAAPASRVVEVSERDVVPVVTRLRFTTLIVLPKEEQILDFVCGDKEFWVVNGSQNFAFVKPAKAGSQTNLNLITASGNVYSFTLAEAGETGTKPDLKVFIEPKPGALLSAMNGQPRFVPAQAVDDYRHQVELAQTAAKKAREEAAEQVTAVRQQAAVERARYREQFPASIQFDYNYTDQPEFNVAAIYRDDKFTYIRASPQETPALYEVRDGKPSLIQFRYHDGLYTAGKVLDRGYLAIGKKRLHFTREERR